MPILQFLTDYFNHLPQIIQISFGLSLVFFILTLFSIVFLKILRSRLRIISSVENKYKRQYEQDLVNYLFSLGDEDSKELLIETIEKFKKVNKSSFRRRILIGVFLKLKGEISGEMAVAIDDLYIKSELIKTALTNLRSNKWYKIANSIREFNHFKVTKVRNILIANYNYPRKEIRIEMELYMVNLFNFKGLRFLNNMKTQMSRWEQIQILEILKNKENHEPSDVTPWLRSENDSVVIFALSLVKIYNLIETKDELLKLIYHASEAIRIEAINVLGFLNISEIKDIIIADFSQRSLEEQLAVFNILEDLYDSSDEDFFKEQLNHPVFDIRVLSRQIIKDINVNKYQFPKPKYIKLVNHQVSCSV